MLCERRGKRLCERGLSMLLAGSMGFFLAATAGCRRSDPLVRRESTERRGHTSPPHGLPIVFEANVGQADPSVAFVARAHGFTLFLRSDDATLAFSPDDSLPGVSGHSLRIHLVGADSAAQAVSADRLPSRSHYLVGQDPMRWTRNVPHSRRARFDEIHPGIGVEYYVSGEALEFDFIVSPSADPSAIELAFDGANSIDLGDDGRLRLDTDLGAIVLQAPFAFQDVGAQRKIVRSAFSRKPGGTIGIEVGSYDESRALVIDPLLEYSALVGGAGFAFDTALDVAVDALGRPYLAGSTRSPDFPITTGAFDGTLGGLTDGFVTRLSADGASIEYSTFVGGSDQDEIQAIALDDAGAVYVTGRTFSADFPTTAAVADTTFAGPTDGFVAKLSSDGGSLAFATLIGGSEGDLPRSIAVDGGGRSWLTGQTQSDDFPLVNPLQAVPPSFSASAIFVTRLSADASLIEFSTFLGALSSDGGEGIAVGPDSSAFVTGFTSSTAFPTTPDAFQRTLRNSTDCFVSRISATGSLLYSTLLGGTDSDYCYDIGLFPDGEAVVTGTTLSDDFPTVAAYQTSPATGTSAHDVFVAKLAPSGGSLVFSTYLSGSDVDQAFGVAVSDAGDTFVTGFTASSDFPSRDSFQPPPSGPTSDADVFLAKLTASGELAYSTFLGSDGVNDEGFAVATDSAGAAAWVAGFAGDGTNDVDAFVAKIGAFAARTDTYSTAEDLRLDVPPPGVLANDEGANVAILETAPANASTFSLGADGSFQYLPLLNFSGIDTFTYRASRGASMTAPATVIVIVTPRNDAPEAVADAFSGIEDTSLIAPAPGVLSNDGDPDGDEVTAVLIDASEHGEVTLEPDGSFFYLPAPNFSGSDSFSYAVGDGALLSAPVIVVLQIEPRNDSPSATGDSYSLAEDSSLNVPGPGVLDNDSDVEGDALSASLVSSPSHGTLVLDASGAFSYTPDEDFFGADSFRYSSSDGSMESAPVTVSLTVAPENDVPTAESDFYEATEDASLSVAAPGVLDNDADPDGDTLAAMLDSAPLHGTLNLGGDGSFVYSPDPNFFGSDTFTYRVGDGMTLSAPVVVTLNVRSTPDAPVARADSYAAEEDQTLQIAQNSGVLANDEDPDQGGMIALLLDSPEHGELSLTPSGAFTYVPHAEFSGPDSFTYRAESSASLLSPTVTVNLTIAPINDTPLAVADSFVTYQDTPAEIPVMENDTGAVDSPLTVVAGPVSNGTVSVQFANGRWLARYVPSADFAGFDVFSYTVTDADGEASTASVSVEVRPLVASGSDKYWVWLGTMSVYSPACAQDTHRHPFVFGKTSDADVVGTCGSREEGPWFEASANLDLMRLHVRAAASGGTGLESVDAAVAYGDAFTRDLYTVLPGTSELPTGARVPVFARVRTKRHIANPHGAGVIFDLEIARRIGSQEAILHSSCATYGTPYVPSQTLCPSAGGAGDDDSIQDIPLGGLELGARLAVEAVLFAEADSGGTEGDLNDPKAAEADVSISLCSTIAGVVIQGASGGVGDCRSRDIAALDVQAVQSVFDATTLVSGKGTVIAVDLSSTFGEPTVVEVHYQMDQANGLLTDRRETVIVPPDCPRKRFYFPNPDPLQQSDCLGSAEALGSFTESELPQANLLLSASVRSEGDTNSSNDSAPARAYVSKPTSLDVIYSSINCWSASCASDPSNYGEVNDSDLFAAARITDGFTLGMFPVSADGYSSSACTVGGTPCETTPGSTDKCTPDACEGLYSDLELAYLAARSAGVDGPVIAFSGLKYYEFHGIEDWQTMKGFVTPGGPEFAISVLIDGPLGRDPDYPGVRTIAGPHELAHYFGLRGHWIPPQTTSGYWVDCDRTRGHCEATSADNLRAEFVSAFEPPDVWIDVSDYAFLAAEFKTDPDPPRLVVTGRLNRAGEFTLRAVREVAPGKVKLPSVATDDKYFIVGLSSDGELYRDGFDVDFDNPPDDWPASMTYNVVPILATIPFPLNLERVQVWRSDVKLADFSPIGMSLRLVIEGVGDRGFAKNPAERRAALLSKVDEFAELVEAGKFRAAQNKLENDIRKHVQEWLVEYRVTESGEYSRAKVFEQIDFLSTRLSAMDQKKGPRGHH